MERKTKKVYAVANNKGGVGKTTTAVNLAYGLSKKLIGENGKAVGAVLLVDLDPQGNAADALGLRALVYDRDKKRDGACVSRLFLGEATLRESIVPANQNSDYPRPNLFLLPASRELEGATHDLLLKAFSSYKRRDKGVMMADLLTHYLEPATSVFTYIVIDCPPKLDDLKEAVYNFADEVIVPTQAQFLAGRGVQQHTADLVDLHSSGAKAELAFILPTIYDHRQKMAAQMLQSMIKVYGRKTVAEPIPNNVTVKEAPARGGLTVLEHAPESPGGLAYQKFVDKVYSYE